jgi:hypothetical protein
MQLENLKILKKIFFWQNLKILNILKNLEKFREILTKKYLKCSKFSNFDKKNFLLKEIFFSLIFAIFSYFFLI